eukprot:augustus_masked-scaffold_2-processed-gene-15.31-mRNA-1 protein AED:1.00 eAED:1.00 QI:0/-1/0/0/-1/1/1/0/446
MQTANNKKINTVKKYTICLETKYTHAIGLESGLTKGYATGFLADLELGIVVTNAHVISRGPVEIKGFSEGIGEFDLDVVYVDPVHDFGFLKMSGKNLREITGRSRRLSRLLRRRSSVKPLSIKPREDIKVGERYFAIGAQKPKELRVLTGEVLALSVDPISGMDFNVRMITGTDRTNPGYSGGPVVDEAGNLFALLASNDSSSGKSFHFPIELVMKKLDVLKKTGVIQRFTAGFSLNSNMEIKFICGDSNAMLLKKDRVIGVNGVEVDSPEELDILIDKLGSAEETNMNILIQSKETEKNVVLDLRKVPEIDSFLKVFDSLIHPIEQSILLYYGLKENFGLFLSQPGNIFTNIPAKSILIEAFGVKLHGLEDLIEVFDQVGIGSRMKVSFVTLSKIAQIKTKEVIVSERLSELGLWNRKSTSLTSSLVWTEEIIPIPKSSRTLVLG